MKISPKGTLTDDALMTDYFFSKGLSARVCVYISDERDYLITEKIEGEDGISQKYLDNPEKLCDVFAESLRMLHEVDFTDCSRKNRMQEMYDQAIKNYKINNCDTLLLEQAGIKSMEDGFRLMYEHMPMISSDVLIHGDYCLPNILLKDFRFAGFIDVGLGGVGDRHYDLYWGLWTLNHNLPALDMKERFFDAYGRDKIDMDRFRLCCIFSAFN